MNKIFGIGLNRTGTGTLATALRILGYKVSHWTHHREISEHLIREDFNFPFLKEYDAVLDLPIPILFKELDKAYPGSKFIYSHRPYKAWIESQENLHRKIGMDKPVFECKLVYGSFYFDRMKYCQKFSEHENEVFKYFEGKSNFLHISTAQFSWGKLCEFLNKPIPIQPFPHVNKTQKKLL